MRTFRSLSEAEAYILSKVRIAVGIAQRKAFTEFNRFVFMYYGEWQPAVYERTRQLLRALSKSDVYGSGNGFGADIYYDVGKMDYSRKNLHKIQRNGKWMHPYVPGVYTSDGVFINHGDAGKVLANAAHGKHGRKNGDVAGTAIWDEPMAILASRYKTIFRQAFEEAGLPVK